MTPFWHGIVCGALWIAFGVASFLTGMLCESASEAEAQRHDRELVNEIKETIRREISRE